ncbi:MAG TPA: hypothetical protein VNE42_11930 [Acidimicrobiales bacterium]|nr:hypothetical protein [Acidimicrobiales bacterium]
MVSLSAVPLRNTVIIPFVTSAFNDQGEPTDPITDISVDVALDGLTPGGLQALRKARAAGELIPGAFLGPSRDGLSRGLRHRRVRSVVRFVRAGAPAIAPRKQAPE